jgi:hypothetical protein
MAEWGLFAASDGEIAEFAMSEQDTHSVPRAG